MELVVVHFIALFRFLSPEIEEKHQTIMIAWTLREIWTRTPEYEARLLLLLAIVDKVHKKDTTSPGVSSNVSNRTFRDKQMWNFR
jgi:hypothetical protein